MSIKIFLWSTLTQKPYPCKQCTQIVIYLTLCSLVQWKKKHISLSQPYNLWHTCTKHHQMQLRSKQTKKLEEECPIKRNIWKKMLNFAVLFPLQKNIQLECINWSIYVALGQQTDIYSPYKLHWFTFLS